MSTQQQYKFTFPDNPTPKHFDEWVNSILELPDLVRELVENCSPKQIETSYREGGWNIRQMVNHLVDSHMHAIIRLKYALCEDKPTIKVYNQDDWVKLEDRFDTPLELSLYLLDEIHAKLGLMFQSLTEEELSLVVIHPEMGELSIIKSAALYAWHGKHHLEQMNIARSNSKKG